MASGTFNVRAVLDMAQREIRNFLAHVLGSDPGTPVEGQVWYHSGEKRLKYRTDAANVTDTDRARHTGSQLASTISDFNTARDAQRLDQHAVPTADIPMNSRQFTGLSAPTVDLNAATKLYVDTLFRGVDRHDPVRAATTGNVATLAGGAPQVIDGVTLVNGDRVLVKDQTTTTQNGIYTVTTAGTGANGTWARATDADAAGDLMGGSQVFVNEGTLAGDKIYFVSSPTGSITPGTTAHTWSTATGSGGGFTTAGAGLTGAGATIDIGLTAGGAIAIAADAIGIDWAATPRPTRKHVAASTAVTSQAITHNLGTLDVVVGVRKVSDGDQHLVNWVATDANTVTINWIAAPGAGEFSVAIVG
jgi:hypothetical protein